MDVKWIKRQEVSTQQWTGLVKKKKNRAVDTHSHDLLQGDINLGS